MNREVLSYKQRLDHLFKRVEAFSGDEELLVDLTRYLCVIVSGFLEVSARVIYSEYARAKAAENVSNYVDKQLRSFQNPNMEKILNLTGAFSVKWRGKLEKATIDVIKGSIDSIVANRNLIAHGRSSGITIGNLKRYYKDAVKLVNIIEKQCNH